MRSTAAWLCAIAVVCMTIPLEASASTSELVEVATRLGTITSRAGTLRATVDRGTTAGLTVGTTGAVYAMRARTAGSYPTVDYNVRIAIARVIEVKAQSATVVLEAVTETIDPGFAIITYQMKAPAELTASPMFRAAALGVKLCSFYEDKPLITFEEMLADPTETLRERAADAMIGEAKRVLEDMTPAARKGRIQGGRFHGQRLDAVIGATDRARLLDYLLYVEAAPSNDIGHCLGVSMELIGWLQNGAPSGDDSRRRRLAASTIAAARDAEAASKLDDARAHWLAVLESIPDHEVAVSALATIDRILQLERHITDDADDTAGRMQLVDALSGIGMHARALTHVDALQARGYDPFQVERKRAVLLMRQRKWREAEAAVQRARKLRTDDAVLDRWIAYARAQTQLARSPDDADAYIRVGTAQEADDDDTGALQSYRRALQVPRVTAKQRETASLAQQRIASRREVAGRVAARRREIEQHDIGETRYQIDELVKYVATLGDPTYGPRIVGELAAFARARSEYDLAIDLFTKQSALAPKDASAHNELAYTLLLLERFADAEAAAKQALARKGPPAVANVLLASLAWARGDVSATDRLATLAAKDRAYGWPNQILARLDAARGDWEDAVDNARRAVERVDAAETRATYTAARRGAQASEALRVDPKSARERLRLARALAELGLVAQHAAEIAKLPADGSWRSDARWALAVSPDRRVLLRDRLAAARDAKPTTEHHKRVLALLEAESALRADAKNDKARINVARHYVRHGRYHDALATLATFKKPLTDWPATISDLVNDASSGIAADEQLDAARAALARGEYDVVLRLTREVQKTYDRIGHPEARAAARALGSLALAQQGKHAEAIVLEQETSKMFAALGHPIEQAHSAQRLAAQQASIGTTDALLQAIEAGRAVCEALDDDECLYWKHLKLAEVESTEGRAANAVEHGRKAWTLAERLARSDLARSARIEVARASLVANRFADAEDIAVELLADSRKRGDIETERSTLLVIATVAMMTGRGDAARRRYDEVYELGTRTGNTQLRALARYYVGLSWLRSETVPAKAIGALEMAARLLGPLTDGWSIEMRGDVLAALAEAHLADDDVAHARTTADDAYAIAQRFQRRPRIASTQWLLALVAIRQQRATDAVRWAQAAVAGAEQTDDPELVWTANYALAQAQQLAGRPEAALVAYDHALASLGRGLAAAGGGDHASVRRVGALYADAMAAFLAANKTDRAMEILELSRVPATRRAGIDPTHAATNDPALRVLLERVEAARARVRGLQQQLATATSDPVPLMRTTRVEALTSQIVKAREDHDQLVIDLRLTHPHLFRSLTTAPQELVRRRTELPPDAALVAYFIADDAIHAFVITAKIAKPAAVRIKVSATELEQTVTDFRTAIIDSETKHSDAVETLGRKLDDWLLEPLRPHLGGRTTLIVLPFGSLHYVPFDALVVSAPTQPVRYAIEDFRFSIQTATTLELLLAPPRPRKTGKLLAIANPDASLAGADVEVASIVKSAMPDAKVLSRANATIERFQALAGNYRYVHIATHGVLDPDPRKTYLKFSNGPLTVQQIARLRGLAEANELVVLSACETALQQGQPTGDELVSLALAFAIAGSPALVASLWEVGDAATAELMPTFYRALEQETGDHLDALRGAKLALLRYRRGKARPFAAPWNWAAFQLYGDFRAPLARARTDSP